MVESKHSKDPTPRVKRVPGVMKIRTVSRPPSSRSQRRVNKADSPGTTEQPTKAIMPAASIRGLERRRALQIAVIRNIDVVDPLPNTGFQEIQAHSLIRS